MKTSATGIDMENKQLSKKFWAIGLLLVFMLGFSNQASAQSSSQVTITGIPSILPTPFADDIENNFATGRYQVIFNYTSQVNQPVDFVFDFVVKKENRTIVDIQSEPTAFTPGSYVFINFFEELVFPQSSDEVLRGLPREIQNQMIQSGVVPEGRYTIEIEARPVAQRTMSIIPGFANFSVRYPPPPILVSPSRESNVTQEVPIFAWTPVVSTRGRVIEYDFLLVEVFDGQTPLQAIEGNRAIAEQTLVGGTTLPYTFEYLPLEEGSRYAWQITARDGAGEMPLQDDGESEIYTFIYREIEEAPLTDVQDIDEIVLIPGFARLTDLSGVTPSASVDAFDLTGPALLELVFEEFGTLETMVNINLLVQPQTAGSPMVLGGNVEGAADIIENILPDENPWIEFEDLFWSFGDQFRVDLSMMTPDQQWFEADGELIVTRRGLSGIAELSGDPLAEYNSEYLDVIVQAIGVEFPGNRFWAEGDARVLGFETPCELQNFNMLDGIIEAGILCNERLNIPLVDNSEFLTMQVNRVRGDIQILPNISDFNFSVDVQSLVGMQTLEGRYCGANTNMNISSDGLNIQTGHSRCALFNPKIDLGFAEVRFENTDVSFLEYDSVAEQWDFELTFDGNLEVPAFDNWSSMTMTGIGVTPDGISFESVDFGDNENLNPLPSFDAQILEITLESFGLSEFTFPIFDWDEQAPGPWEIDFEGSAMVQSGTGVPMCLLGTSLEATNGRVDQGRVISNLELGDFEGCSWEIGPGYEIQVDALSGIAGVDYPGPDEIQPFGNVNLSGGISLGYPFDCGDEMFSFSGDDLILSDGIQGTLTNVVPQCPLNVGPFTAQVTSSDVEFSVNDQGAQQAIMSADAFVQLPDGLQVQGSVVINLMTGEFLDVSFIIDEPFDWNIPSDENPVLTFRLNRAEINQNGFLVDGRHRFMLPNSQMGVTFDNLLIDLNTFSIQSGRIIFDEEFAFEVGIADNLADLSFQAVEMDSELTLDPGLLMELSGNIQIDSLGVHSSGTAEASLAFSGRNYDSLVTVEYTDDFRLGLYPFSVTSGQADFYFDGDRFAYVDPSGFNPVMAFFAEYLVPERLPLPTEDIAYLQLREDDELLVDVTEDENGNLQISTIPGQALSLVVPYIEPDSPPTLADVTIEDLTISANPISPEVLSGSITADVPTDDPAFTLTDRNVPVSVETIQFGNRNVNGSSITALYMMGNLHLFDQEVEDENKVEFYLRGDGHVRAAFDISGMDSQFSIAPQDRVIVGVDALSGSFDMSIGSSDPNYDFSIAGSMEILTDEGYRAGADLTIRTTSDGYFTISEFDGYAFDESPRIGIGDFGLDLDQIVDIPYLTYSSEDGFEFAVDLDLSFNMTLSGGQQIYFPLKDISIRNDGIHFPKQTINDSEIPGLNLPSLDILGFTFQPLAFNTPSVFTYSWEEGPSLDLDFMMDFSVELPEFVGSGILPADGITFIDVGYDEGFLVGSVDPIVFDAPPEIPVAPGDMSPTLLVEEISGALAKVPSNSFRQAIDFDISGTVGNLPAFTVDDPEQCGEEAEYSLSIVEGRALEGTITNVQPCGYLELGPVTLEVPSANLEVYLDEDEQVAILDGGVDVTLPSPDGGTPAVISGELALDAISGRIHDGSVSITQPFGLNMPYFQDDDPLFTFAINQATLDSEGLTLTGSGNLEKGDVNASVTFDELTIGLPEFNIAGGSATIQSDFDVQFAVNPFGYELVGDNVPLPADNALRMELDASVILDQHGLSLTGTADANLLYSGDQYSNLRVELVDDFAMSISGLSVNRGRAEFYWDEGGVPAVSPIAYIDQDGFHFGSGLLAFLPDRIPLPIEDIAYIKVKDDDGEPLVEIESTDSGMLITSDGDYLELVIPSLENQQGEELTVGVSFSLETDDAYNVTGGSLALQSNYSLEDRLNLPVTLTDLELEDDDGIKLSVGLTFDLPAVFEGHEAALFATLSESGIESGTFSVGNVGTSYESGLVPVYTFDYSGSVSGSSEQDMFEASLLGIEATFGSNSVSFAGTLNSSLIIEDGEDPVFFNATWGDGDWSFTLDPGGALQDMRLGQTTFSLDDYEPLDIVSDGDNFYLTVNGQVSFEDVLEEDIIITVQDLQVGVTDYQSSPSLHFALGSAVGDLGPQEFGLFDNAVEFTLSDPFIALQGRNLSIGSDGSLGFLEQQINFTGLEISTAGYFNLDEASISDVEIFENYLVLQSFSLTFDEGPRVETELELNLPAPVQEYSTTGQLAIYRENGTITVDNAGLQFDLDERYELLDFGEFELSKVRAEADPLNWGQTGVYANGAIYLGSDQDPVIEFGKASDFPNQAGIGITYTAGQQIGVQYDITGNIGFEFDLNFFRIDVTADMNTTSGSGFEIVLGGEADLNLDAVEANLTYSGLTVTEEGIKNYGNIENGSIDVIGVASLSVGQFIYIRDDTGFEIDVASTEEKNPKELQTEGNFETKDIDSNSIEVQELLCFGPCPEIRGDVEDSLSQGYDEKALKLTIGGDSQDNTGGISGGVDRITFYQSGELRSLTVENLNVEFDDIFQMSASINYEQDDSGTLLRAAATGSFNVGDVSASAIVSGKFSTMEGDVSYGLFVAVHVDAGIPIVPGVLTLTGAGGGFFYRPEQADLDMVQAAMQASETHTLVNAEYASIQGDTDFAILLYASLAIGGADPNVVEGSTFFQITKQTFYMDARTIVLGMDGKDTIANTKITGEMSFSIKREPFALLMDIDVVVDVPVILSGNGKIEFFYVEKEDVEDVWGIIGDVSFSVYSGILNGSAEFLAGNPGFMFEVSLTFDLDIKIMDIKSGVTGSIWVMTDPEYLFPFGAYVVFDVEASILKLPVLAEARAAIVTRNPSGYELFATVYGCAKFVFEKCGSVWASYSSQDGIGFGAGAGSHADHLAQAQQQQEDFRNNISSLMDGMDDAMEALNSEPSFTDYLSSAEDAQKAGYNLYKLPESIRHAWVNEIYNESETAELPTEFRDLVNNVMRSTGPKFPSPGKISGDVAVSIWASLQDMITEDMLTAYDLEASAEQSYQQVMATMSTSPVQNVVKPNPSTEANQSVSFHVNDDIAGPQIQSTEQYRAEMELLDEQIRADIDAVRDNLDTISNLLQTDTPTTEDNHLINAAHWFGDNHMQMERYYALKSNKIWNEHFWARNHLSYLNTNRTKIKNAIAKLSNDHIRANESEDVESYAWDLAQREIFMYELGRVHQFSQPSISNPDVSPTPQYIRNMYNSLIDPFSSTDDIVLTTNDNFWWEMNFGGLETLDDAKYQTLINFLSDDNQVYKEQLLSSQKNITLVLDEFYNIKANISAILFNMVDEYLEWRVNLSELQEEEDTDTPVAEREKPVAEREKVDTDDGGGIGGMIPLGRQPNSVQFLDLDIIGMLYSSLRNTLAQQLQPPQIFDITASPNRPENNYVDTYYNETEIEWNAAHPEGIIETSVSILYPGGGLSSVDTDITVGIEDYLSIGNRSSFTLYNYRGFSSDNRNVNFGVRVRGVAGNTAMRRASFRVDVGPLGSSSVEPGESIVPEITNPPPPPSIDLTQSFILTDFNGEEIYWTSMPQDIQLVITAHDPVLGIGKWEYAIGTTPGGNDVEDWRLLQGQIEFLPELPAHRITAPARSLDMQPGVEYFISARVENTLGQVSSATELSSPLIYDNEGPSDIIFEYIQPESHVSIEKLSTMVLEPVNVVPPFTSDMNAYETWTKTYGDAILLFEEIGASDDMSGVSHFEYIFSNDEEPPTNRFGIGDYQVLEDSDLKYKSQESPAELTYDKNPYWHIRGVDNAGNKGDIYTFGPFEAFDFTIPNAGKLKAKAYDTDVKIYIIDPPYDPESDIKGIQYAVGTYFWNDDLRAFPEESNVDLEWSLSKSEQLLNGSGNPQRFISIPRSDLPEPGNSFYILYRSVNTKGMYSDNRATGPIILDYLPPKMPDVNVQVDMKSRRMHIDVMNISDSEVGITKVEYAILSRNISLSRFDINLIGNLGWSDFINNTIKSYKTPKFGTFELNTISPSISDEYDVAELRVRVRVTNAAGKTRTRTVEINENDLFNIPDLSREIRE